MDGDEGGAEIEEGVDDEDGVDAVLRARGRRAIPSPTPSRASAARRGAARAASSAKVWTTPPATSAARERDGGIGGGAGEAQVRHGCSRGRPVTRRPGPPLDRTTPGEASWGTSSPPKMATNGGEILVRARGRRRAAGRGSERASSARGGHGEGAVEEVGHDRRRCRAPGRAARARGRGAGRRGSPA